MVHFLSNYGPLVIRPQEFRKDWKTFEKIRHSPYCWAVINIYFFFPTKKRINSNQDRNSWNEASSDDDELDEEDSLSSEDFDSKSDEDSLSESNEGSSEEESDVESYYI